MRDRLDGETIQYLESIAELPQTIAAELLRLRLPDRKPPHILVREVGVVESKWGGRIFHFLEIAELEDGRSVLDAKWEPISTAKLRERFPEPEPEAPPAPSKPLTLSERVARLEAIARRNGTLRD